MHFMVYTNSNKATKFLERLCKPDSGKSEHQYLNTMKAKYPREIKHRKIDISETRMMNKK